MTVQSIALTQKILEEVDLFSALREENIWNIPVAWEGQIFLLSQLHQWIEMIAVMTLIWGNFHPVPVTEKVWKVPYLLLLLPNQHNEQDSSNIVARDRRQCRSKKMFQVNYPPFHWFKESLVMEA